jgi:hypothetical protein
VPRFDLFGQIWRVVKILVIRVKRSMSPTMSADSADIGLGKVNALTSMGYQTPAAACIGKALILVRLCFGEAILEKEIADENPTTDQR